MQKSAGLGTLLVLGLGLGMLRNGTVPSPSLRTVKPLLAADISSSPTTCDAKCLALKCPQKNLLDTIDEFLPPAKNAADGTNQTSNECVPVEQKLHALSPGNKISFAIAIVPDPVHTHLSLFFDRSMDAIQQGTQGAGWMFDRASMPWDDKEHPESTDFRIRLGQEEYQEDKEEWPGLMIFRSPDPPGKLQSSLFVFIVAETPTGGINKKEFSNAIDSIREVGPQASPILRIIGPTFSGSLYSLAQLLDQNSVFSHVVIRSGTISSWNTAQWFITREESEKKVDFATFQDSDRYMLRRFIQFEQHRGYAPDEIAVLTEDETAYGNATPQQPAGNVEKECDPAITASNEAQFQANEACLLRLYFPRDISQLRSSYQQELNQPAPSADNHQVRSTLPLNLQDSGSDDDSVPQYAHFATPLSQESILIGIVTMLRERKIKFVVLQATNPMDTVFLSTFLKKSYSDARVVVIPADLLLSRDVDDVSLLHGIMALTTYSLLPDADWRASYPNSLPRKHGLLVFPTAYSAGTYNAALSQLICLTDASNGAKGCEASPTGLPVARYTEYGWPTFAPVHSTKPPPLAPVLWLTALGRNGFWPLAVLDEPVEPNSDMSYPFKAGDISSSPRQIETCPTWPPTFDPPWPLFWKTVCGIVLLLAVIFCWLLSEGTIAAPLTPATLFAPVRDPARHALIVITGWLILTTVIMLEWPWFRWFSFGWVLIPVGLGITVVIALCLVCYTELRRREAVKSAIIFLFLSFITIILFGTLASIAGHSRNAFLYRYIHLTSGVSPVLPFLILIMGALWWIWWTLAGLALVDKRRPRLPGNLPAGLAGAASLSDHFAKGLVYVARPFSWNLGVFGPSTALAVITLLTLDYGHPMLTLEARHFEWIFALAAGAVTFVMFAEVSRLFAIWLECNRMLSALDRLPLRRAFSDLDFAWQPIWRFGGGRYQDLYRLVSRQIETLQRLGVPGTANPANDQTSLLRESIEATIECRERISQQVPTILDPSNKNPDAKEPSPSNYLVTLYGALQEKIAETCGVTFAYLLGQWADKEGICLSETDGKEKGKENANKRVENENMAKVSFPTRLAERFVALVYLNFILTLLLRIRTLAIAAGGLYIFLLISINSYPFEPKIVLRTLSILMLLGVVGMVGYVFAQIHRDSILSRVTGTNPGELGSEFWVRITTFAALPLLSLLVSQYPAFNNALFSWLEPAVNALR